MTPWQLQQQDLEAGLLAAGEPVEGLLGLLGQLVAAQPGHGRAPVLGVFLPQDVEQRAALQLRVGVRLREVARHDPGAELPLPRVRHVVAGEQPQEVGLAGAVGAEDGDPLAVEDLQVEGFHQPGELESLAGDGPHARCARP